MKYRPAVLIWGAVLIAAAPVWGDRIPYPGSPQDSPHARILAEPTPAGVLIKSVQANNAFALSDSKSSNSLETFVPTFSDMGIHSAGLSHFDAGERFATNSRAREGWHEESGGSRGNGPDEPKVKPVVTLVPEPGTLPLLLLGLPAVAFFARQRGKLPAAG